ncbi:putative Scaffold protein Nfu/NifU [Nitrospina gracilis 3/211]|uniref:Putative Scaffold protein Nfu/NifU n=1 Tax=Nitrospina gracilis (strain 3/211) TaxID=1266370 RepID=M1YZ49_NITG3|nr:MULTISPECIES: NifU family protein [Nitrospina]MCF8723665.1 Fe-S cluster biogenesis protein NfuA [Nitrospina sp. Nb-3]CCQ90752.1 putative Scaffold protein Nfu/NifU [Nitrospina gracilis 3/211]
MKSGFKVMTFHHTPNPEAAQFIMSGDVIARGTRTFSSPDSARGDALAEALFNIYGVENVFIKENFVTITKSPVVGWTTLMEPVQNTLEKNMTFYETSDEDQKPESAAKNILEEVEVEDFPNLPDKKKKEVIDALLDHAIRPALANDGGGITLLDVKGKVVHVHYQGACGSCPSSTTGTLQYIENFLQNTLSQDLKVEADNASLV